MVTVHIDCATCVVRDVACHDCVVSVLLGQRPESAPRTGIELGRDEQAALDALAGSGLVPPLRHRRDPGQLAPEPDGPRAAEQAAEHRGAAVSPSGERTRTPAGTGASGVPRRRVERPDAPPLRLIQGAHPARAIQPSFDWEEFG